MNIEEIVSLVTVDEIKCTEEQVNAMSSSEVPGAHMHMIAFD